MKQFNNKLSEILIEISIASGAKMTIDPYEKHHYLFLKNKETESIKLTTKQAQKLANSAKEHERLDMGRVRFWF